MVTKILLAVFSALFLGCLLFWQWAIKPVNPSQTTATIFVIPQGQTVTTIGRRLAQQHLIKNQLVFKLLVDKKNYTNKLQAGDFKLSPSMDLNTILETLTHGSLDFWITFPEGLRAEEYAQKLFQKTGLDPQEFILVAKPFEGHLFPDTYLIPQTASAQSIVDLLTTTFNQKSPTQDEKIIILASLIEREAKHDQDRPLVSSVLHNRLNLGMALQIDATVQYILGTPKGWWPNNLTRSDLETPSPFNTYQHSGLPPKPIANPGLASLKAALNPAKTDYLYYVSDSSGYNHYAKDLAGHNQNINRYLNP